MQLIRSTCVALAVAAIQNGIALRVGDSSEEEADAPKGCASAARRMLKIAKPVFDDVLKRGYVTIDESGAVTLPKLANKVPFVPCANPTGGPAKACKSFEIANKTTPNVKNTLNDLKKLLAVVGVKKGVIVGLAGGRSYGPDSGRHPEWGDQWAQVAGWRAEKMVKELGIPMLTAQGQWAADVGVRIDVMAQVSVAKLKAFKDDGKKCDDDGLTPAAVLLQAEAILKRGNLAIASDGAISLKKFVENKVPFASCSLSSTSVETRIQQAKDCIPKAEVATTKDPQAQSKIKASIKDMIDLGDIMGVETLKIIGYATDAGKFNKKEETQAIRQLAAARARALVKIIQKDGPDSELGEAAGKLDDVMGKCADSGSEEACSEVSGIGKIGVDIQLETLMNTAALAPH